MPVITESELKNALSKDSIKSVYILFGDDGYLIGHYVDVLIDKTCGKDNDFDLQKFERDVDLQAVYDSVNQFPMTCERRCTVLSDYNFESATDSDFERLLSLVSDNYETATLVLQFEAVEFDPKRSSRAKRLVSACDGAFGAVAALNHRTAAELSKMLQNGAKKRGKTLEKPVADFLIENCGEDINTLVNELEKLCRFSENSVITKEDVDTVCTKSVEASVYEYAKKIILCDTRGSLKILNDLFYMRFEPMLILYSAAATFVDIARVSAASKVHIPLGNVAQDFPYKNKDFVLRNALGYQKRFNDRKLSLCFSEILDADRAIKSFSGNEKLILEQMTVRLIYIIANGESVDKT